MARKALGRGLDALIPSRAPEEPSGSRLTEVAIEKIRPNPQQPRDHFEESAIDAIAASLAEHGLLQPVVLRDLGDGNYELIAGERRWRGAQRAGIEKLPAVVRDVTPKESLELAIIENVQREDLNAIEEAEAYRLLIDEMSMTQAQVAERVGRDRATVANYLRLLKLAPTVQGSVISGDLSMGHARALLGTEDHAAQQRFAERVIGKGLSVRQTEALVRNDQEESGKIREKKPRDPDVAAAEARLSRTLGAPVAIRGKDKGRLEIRFNSLDELNRLYDLLTDLGN
ncbi:MAG: ParB/RepB/Spo0J family partition protein [Acidobacteria bacterium]|nr:ParB/RepB/Spo0J family partition protein [Acidobacteriota bacterium]